MSTTISGNLTRDPELRFSTSGRPSCSFGLAVNRRWKDSAGEWQEAVSFITVTCWADLAEHVSQSLHKGDRALVHGRLEQRSWETNGEKKSVLELIADEVGASLKWADATVQRAERQSARPQPEQPAATQSWGDEEPF